MLTVTEALWLLPTLTEALLPPTLTEALLPRLIRVFSLFLATGDFFAGDGALGRRRRNDDDDDLLLAG